MTGPSTDGSIDWCFDTPRLHGRLVDERDRDVYRALYTDPAMMAHIGPALARDAADALHAKVCGWNRETPMRARSWCSRPRGRPGGRSRWKARSTWLGSHAPRSVPCTRGRVCR